MHGIYSRKQQSQHSQRKLNSLKFYGNNNYNGKKSQSVHIENMTLIL